MAREVGDKALGQRALVEPVVEQPHVGALQVRLVGRGGAPEQPCLFPRRPPAGINVQVHERARSHALRFSQGSQVGDADIANKDAARAEQAKRGGPGATAIIEREQMRH